jgi:uncharacterized protein (TIGR03067 family)
MKDYDQNAQGRPMSKQIRLSVVLAILLLALVPPRGAGAADDIGQLQGQWNAIAVFRDGARLPDNGGYVGILIYDNKIVFGHQLDDAATLRFRANPWKSPRHFDVYDEQGKTLLQPGIYEIAKGKLKLCQGNPRPTEFETKKGDGRILFLLERDESRKPKARRVRPPSGFRPPV